MKKSLLLLVDGWINLLLGFVLLFFPAPLADALGLPEVETAFYPSILGAVLVGIGLALLVQKFGGADRAQGLGLRGAIAINLCGGAALALWLLSGELAMPARGYAIFWGLVLVVKGISAVEFYSIRG